MSESTMKWYVLRAVGGKEKKAKEYLEKEIERFGLSHLVGQVIVPTEKVYKVKDGKRVVSERFIFPSYVLIEAELTGELQYIIRNEVPHMTGFLTQKKGDPNPVPFVTRRSAGSWAPRTRTHSPTARPSLTSPSERP